METCYKAFTAVDAEARCRWKRTASASSRRSRPRSRATGFRLYEVPISYNGRRYDEGKKITWRDGLAALWFIFKYRFSSNYSDPGKVTLDAMEAAPQFNEWMYESVKPWLGARVAELGVGRGNLSKHIRKHEHVLLTDYRIDYLTELQRKWADQRDLRIGKLDMTAREDYEQLREFAPDSVVFLNVLEHIEDDRAVLRSLMDTVPAGCRVVVLVPYNMKLYSEFDRALGHFRRYAQGELEGKMREAGFEVEKQFFFNKFGIFAWYVANTLGGQKGAQAVAAQALRQAHAGLPRARCDPADERAFDGGGGAERRGCFCLDCQAIGTDRCRLTKADVRFCQRSVSPADFCLP